MHLLYRIAMLDGEQHGWDETLLLNPYGRVAEGAITNVFLIKNKIISTPPVTEGCIAGVMRQYLIDELPRRGFTIVEKPITMDQLAKADEVFLTNAIRRIKWVGQCYPVQYGHTLTADICGSLF